MKKKIIGIGICMLLMGTTSIALADWAPGDGHKMHFPQMPDPVGWDVNFHDYYLADDWQCSKTGPVKDIHFWISWRGDIVGTIPFITLSIYSNNPQTPYSQPNTLLWTRTMNPDQFIIAGPWTGDQGWLEPSGGFILHDHHTYYQINVKNISAPFQQQNGTIYWLVIQMPLLYPIEIGWKTTQDHFMDKAVWGSPGQWIPIVDPITQLPIDFAFVIDNYIIQPLKPDLSCRGALRWDKVKPKATVTGTFQIGNIGANGSLLNWKVDSWPTWGNWTFSPKNGTNLPKGNWVNITATVVAPPEKKTNFTGKVKIINIDNTSDYCEINVYLKTPKNLNLPFLPFLQKLLERFPHAFPILRHLMGY